MTDEEILATADACGLMLFGLGLNKAKFEFCILAFAKQIAKLERHHEREALAQTQEPWCMKMNGCKTKCEDCPDEPNP